MKLSLFTVFSPLDYSLSDSVRLHEQLERRNIERYAMCLFEYMNPYAG